MAQLLASLHIPPDMLRQAKYSNPGDQKDPQQETHFPPKVVP